MREYDVDEELGQKAIDVRKETGTFEVELGDGTVFESYSVILATGGSRRKLGLESEDVCRNKGVGYCAVCDGPAIPGEEVAVIGEVMPEQKQQSYLSDICGKKFMF